MAKALYRKYRPANLDQVIGQDTVVDNLKTAIKKDSISHAYLFIGPRGCGKTSVARIFAHEINHFKYELEDNYTDIIEIDAASNTGVDNIRDLREKAVIAPAEGKYKIYIIDEVHMLSKSAFNALLKILEEPPRHVVFILATTNPEKIPVTIISRAQTFQFKLSDPKTMLKHLRSIADSEKIKITDDALEIIVRRGGGSFRDSISLLDQISNLSSKEITGEILEKALGLPKDKICEELLAACPSADVVKITTLLKDLLNSGIGPESIASELIEKILTDPRKEYLPLLAKLPTVVAPFAEAKLLVALLGDLATSSQNYQPAKPIKDKAKSPFSWDEFLASVKSQSRILPGRLEKIAHKAKNGILNLYPDTEQTKSILNHDRNKAVLVSALKSTGFQLKIHEPGENQDSQPSNFSAIMGPTQEVKNGGESPF